MGEDKTKGGDAAAAPSSWAAATGSNVGGALTDA